MSYLKNTDEIFVIPPDHRQTFENQFVLSVGQKEIVKMKMRGDLTERDLKIAKFLFQFTFATSSQIHAILNDESSLQSVEKRLDTLVKYRVINRFMLGPFESQKIASDAFYIYCLDLGGRYLLDNYSNEDTSDWYTTVNMKTSEIISKSLMSTEFYVRLLQTLPDQLIHFKKEPELRIGKKNIVPSFEFSLRIGHQNRYYIGEVVREYDFPIHFREKAEKLEDLLTTNGWKKYYYEADNEPVLLVFADSDLTARDAGRLLVNSTKIEKFRLSTDERAQKELGSQGAFMRYLTDADLLQEVKATAFAPIKKQP